MTWKTPSAMPPGCACGPTSAQVARRERLAASRTSSQRVRIISASAAGPEAGVRARDSAAAVDTGAGSAAGGASAWCRVPVVAPYTASAPDALQQRYSPLATALIIGIPWALWHLRSMIQIGQSPALILWGLAGTVAVRLIYVWLYNRAGRAVAILILCHTIANTARTAYPGGRAAYELGDGAISYGIIIAAALLILAANWRAMTSHPGASV